MDDLSRPTDVAEIKQQRVVPSGITPEF